jgi:septal ring factor EnvC (AmiA/AmiB activator)
VNFYYKPENDDGKHQLQYGLIAEEVAKLYPELVAYDQDGQALTVKYQELAPMLLNELQKQNAQIQNQAQTIQAQQEENRKLEDRLAALEALLSVKLPAAGAQR